MPPRRAARSFTPTTAAAATSRAAAASPVCFPRWPAIPSSLRRIRTTSSRSSTAAAAVDDLEDVVRILRNEDGIAGQRGKHTGDAAAARLVAAAAVVGVKLRAARLGGIGS